MLAGDKRKDSGTAEGESEGVVEGEEFGVDMSALMRTRKDNEAANRERREKLPRKNKQSRER